MADSSANSIARKCRKLESTMVMVKSDQAGTQTNLRVIPQISGEQWSSWLHFSGKCDKRNETK